MNRPVSPRFANNRRGPLVHRAWRSIRSLFERPREELNHAQRLVVDSARFVARTPRRIVYDRCLFHASALAYQTLLGLVPILALTLAILSNPGFEKGRTRFLDKVVDGLYPVEAQGWGLDPSDRVALEKLNRQGKALVRETINDLTRTAGRVGLAGFLGLLAVVVMLYRNIESSFNLLWGVERSRGWLRQALRAALFLLALPLAVWASLILKRVLEFLPFLGHHSGPGASLFWRGVYPFLVVSFVLTLIYRTVPRAKVQFRAALGAGLLAGLALESSRHLFTYYAVKILKLSHTYGALAVMPMVLVWLYLSWAVVLFGAEAAHVLQHMDQPDGKPPAADPVYWKRRK